MAIMNHPLMTADGTAMTELRAMIAAHPMAMNRASFDGLFEQVPPADEVEYSESIVGGIPGVWCLPTVDRAASAMLYLHGGGFVYGSARAFRHFAGQIAARAGVPAFIADYRLAPEFPFPSALDDARAAFRALITQFGPGRVGIVGDSAGGGMAISLLRQERDAACGVLLSPWTDLALTGESLESNAAADPFLTRATLEMGARQYLREHNPRDPVASPLYGPMHATSPIQVHVGTAEILLDDSLRLGAVDDIEVHAWEGMPHVFPSNIRVFEAAHAAIDLIAAFLRREIPIASGLRSGRP